MSGRILFKDAVEVRRDAAHHNPHVPRRIGNVHEALASLYQYGLEEFRRNPLGKPSWEKARVNLLRAVADPSPERVKSAQDAFEDLLRRAGI